MTVNLQWSTDSTVKAEAEDLSRECKALYDDISSNIPAVVGLCQTRTRSSNQTASYIHMIADSSSDSDASDEDNVTGVSILQNSAIIIGEQCLILGCLGKSFWQKS